MSLYTNSTGKDTVRNAFSLLSNRVGAIYLASPFFSEDTLITGLLDKGIFTRLIVRLGPSTSPIALGHIFDRENIQIRYFTSPLFHSKLYIFGDTVALVGSANLTQSGIQSNREICVAITSEDERFERLQSLYQSYWNEAEVLSSERLARYEKLCKKFKAARESDLEQSVLKEFGEVAPTEGIQVGREKPSKEKVFLESYRRTYQEFLSAYQEVEAIYQTFGKRQQSEETVPLRIEIDQFFSFVRERYATGDSYKYAPFRHGPERKKYVESLLADWFGQRWEYLDHNIVANVPRIITRLGSVSSIQAASMQEILDALDVCHAFHDRFRFYLGGVETMWQAFVDDNKLDKVKKVLVHLLHENDDFITRMGNCIYDEEYSLHHIGRSVVQELLGWVNKENIPICNGRTVKALRYLGFNVVVFN
jgi:hypothetical protein